MNTEAPPEEPRGAGFAISIYLVAFVTGAIVMSFEMLGSRYLAPAFGAGIYTWASLISTVLAALCAGYFLGGYVADRYPSPTVLGATVAIGSVYLLLLPAFSEQVLQFFAWQIDDIKLGSLAAAMAIMLFPVTFFGMYSPFAIRLLMRLEAERRRDFGNGLRHLDSRQHPRHARDHVFPDPADRNRARSPLRSASWDCSAGRCCSPRLRRGGGGPPGLAYSRLCLRRRRRCSRRSAPKSRSIRKSAPACWHGTTGGLRTSRPSTTTSS